MSRVILILSVSQNWMSYSPSDYAAVPPKRDPLTQMIESEMFPIVSICLEHLVCFFEALRHELIMKRGCHEDENDKDLSVEPTLCLSNSWTFDR